MTRPDPINHRQTEFGAALARARCARGMDATTAGRACLLSDRQVIGLETGEYGAFYTGRHIEQAARGYAAFVGVSTDLPGFPTYHEDVAVEEAPEPSPIATAKRRWREVASVCGIAGGLVSILFVTPWSAVLRSATAQGGAEPKAVAQVALAPIPPPATPVMTEDAPEGSAIPPPAGVSVPPVASPTLETARSDRARRFFLRVTDAVEVRIIDQRGVALLQGRLDPGAAQSLTGDPPFTVETTNADATEIYYLGSRVRPSPADLGRATATFGALPM
jgi:Domain of unknown function (DUF4115)